MAYKVTDYINFGDSIMIIQDGCIKIISLEDFIKMFALGGFSICEAWLNCVDGIGSFGEPEPQPDTPPTMQDLFLNPTNRENNLLFTADDFLNKYFDEDGDAFGKVIITGGDVSGFKLNGVPIQIGMIILATDLNKITYDSKNQDASFVQDLFFDTYDVNNVKAISI